MTMTPSMQAGGTTRNLVVPQISGLKPSGDSSSPAWPLLRSLAQAILTDEAVPEITLRLARRRSDKEQGWERDDSIRIEFYRLPMNEQVYVAQVVKKEGSYEGSDYYQVPYHSVPLRITTLVQHPAPDCQWYLEQCDNIQLLEWLEDEGTLEVIRSVCEEMGCSNSVMSMFCSSDE